MDEWEIDKPLGKCAGTGKEIEPGQEYVGALVETPEGLQRRDFSAEFWEETADLSGEVYCFWRTRLPFPTQRKRIFVDDQMLMAFFERLENEKEQDKINFRFVLALVLMRKKRLKYDSTHLDGDKEIWRLRITGENDFVEVINPRIDEEQIKQLSSQIGDILQTDL